MMYLMILLSLLFTGVVEAGQDLLVTTDCKPYELHGQMRSTCEPGSATGLMIDLGIMRSGGKTPAGTWAPIQVDRDGYVIPSPCYRRMQEAMKSIAPFLPSKTGDAAVQEFHDTMKECVQ